jgi:predicted membrane protein
MKKAVTLLCCFNILCILILHSAERKLSQEHLFYLLCQVFILYFVTRTYHDAPVIQVAEGVETTLMRKKIQEINWKILWYKSSVLSVIKNHSHHHHHHGHLRNSRSEVFHKTSTIL